MTASPSSVVTRVVDYEPPVGTEPTPAGAVAHDTAPKRRHLHAVRAAEPDSANRRAAAAFTDAALRGVLEVIDQRRPPIHLRPLLVGGLVDTVAAVSRAVHQRGAAAVLRRVRLQAVDPADEVFEVAAVYSRGARTHALACRAELRPSTRGVRWQLTALHLG